MATGCIYTYNGKEYPENDFKNLLLSGELDGLLPKEVVDELPVAEKSAAKKGAPEEKKEAAPAEPKAKSKLAKFKEKHLAKPAEQPLTNTVSEGSVGVVDVKLEKPSAEQQLKDIQEGNMVTFEYKNESEVPEVFKDKISSKGEINGKPYVKVTMAKSLADYHLQEQSISTKPEIKNETTQEPIKADEPALTEEQRQQRIQSLTEEKQQKVNEVTKPEITFDTGLSLTDLAGTSEANRQLHDDYKSQLASLKNIINCLWQ